MNDVPDALARALAHAYRLERVIGCGGMAVVYLAGDVRHSRRVAVKVLNANVAASLGVERFLREIQIAAQLQHPHILTLIDSGEAGGIPYYVMPYVDGESLRSLLTRRGTLNTDEAFAITQEAAGAIAYAHGRGVIHRDIKPENVLLSAGHAVVADFGIAKAISTAGSVGLTRTGYAMGTLGYMSPEQAAGRSDLDERTDVYSLACVHYEMLVGEPPSFWLTDEALRLERLVAAPDDHRLKLDALPSHIEPALVRGLALEATNRFSTPTEFTAALERDSAAAARYGTTDIRRIIKHAAEQEATEPTEEQRSLRTVQQIGAEVGIPARQIREAARELEGRDQSPQPSWFLGAPTVLTFEEVVEGEVSETEYPILVEEMRDTVRTEGQERTVSGRLIWRARPQQEPRTATDAQSLVKEIELEALRDLQPSIRDVVVRITPRNGRTRVRVEERLAGLAGALFGGIMGGAGGGGTALSIGLGLTLLNMPLLAIGGPLAFVGGSYALSRAIYRGQIRKRSQQLAALAGRIAAHIAETV